MQTREVFLGFSEAMKVAFYVAATLAVAVFAYGVFLKVRKYARGRPERRWSHLAARIGWAVSRIASNSTVARRDRFAGMMHFGIFWGFLTLFAGTVILTIDYDIVRVVNPAWRFFKGGFYLGYSVTLDVLGIAFIVGLVAMGLRRRSRPPQLDYARVDRAAGTYSREGFIRGDRVFLRLLLAIAVTGYAVEALRIAGTGRPSFEAWSPVGWTLAGLFPEGATTLAWHRGVWWLHAFLSLGFVAYLPYSKAVHILADVANLLFRDPQAGKRLPAPAATEDRPSLGYARVEDLTWKQLLDLDACTRCGRCHQACPARAAGAPLSPRDLILDLRQHADAALARLAPLGERRNGNGGAFAPGGDDWQIAGSLVPAETFWSCTTCLACVEACPVGIEHVPLIVQFRRKLVEDGEIEPSLQKTLMSFAKQGNSFGQGARQRGRWTQGLPFQVKDARKEPVDVLWFVGDFASFDGRVQRSTRTVAELFGRAGLDFGILYDGERCAGNDVRRVGEEGLFEMLVEQNVETLAACEFREIVTTDPHTLNTLRNEYPERGASYTVTHYTEMLVRLIEAGRLVVTAPLGRRVTYHDPCYLARYNGVTGAPRRLLELIGAELVEMPRHGANTFCCGAGGGRIWMDDSALAERPSENRIREALALGGIGEFVVACPKDLTMYEAAAKSVGVEGSLSVRDIIELVEEATRPAAPAAVPVAAGEARA